MCQGINSFKVLNPHPPPFFQSWGNTGYALSSTWFIQDSVGYESSYSHLNEWFSSVLVRVQGMQLSLPALAKGCWCRMLAGSK